MYFAWSRLLVLHCWLLFHSGCTTRKAFQAGCLRMLCYSATSSISGHYEANLDRARKGDLPEIGTKTAQEKQIDLLIGGDSHALAVAELSNMLAEEYDLKGWIASRSATTPLLDTGAPKKVGRRLNGTERFSN